MKSFGILLFCFRAIDTNLYLCVIQQLEQQLSLNGDEILSEFDCPVLELTDQIILVQPTSILGPVSIVHLCTDTCKIVHEAPTRLYERGSIALSTRQLVFKHDFTNRLYCANIIYCTGNYF